MTKNTQDFLIEIGTEELPPKDLKNLISDFTSIIISELNREQLSFSNYKSFATPRRLALIINDLSLFQPDKIIKRKGPALSASFDKNNKPTKAALGFAKSCNVDLAKIDKLETDSGSWLYYEQKQKGKNTKDILPNIIATSCNNLPVKRRMKWNELDDNFVRPVHWVVALLGKEVIPFEIFNIKANNTTFGHRFMSKKPIKIDKIENYEKLLEQKGHVIPCFTKRQNYIKTEIENACKKINCSPLIHDWLLDEVTALVENPNILVANFSEEFLKLPKEVLISSIEEHQRCFPIKDKNDKLVAKFLITSNLKSKDPAKIIAGNEKVMHARLKDAAFYYKVDQKTNLFDNVDKLKNVVFVQSLGSLYDKAKRMSNIAQFIAEKLGLDKEKVEKASLLSKTDLLTHMVIEFPKLQGHMGGYYAELQNIDVDIAHAIRDHYMPLSAKSSLPKTRLGICISLADKLDSLVGLFGINKIPTGQTDPFALRRKALGILRILIEKEINIDLTKLLNITALEYEKSLQKSLQKPLQNKHVESNVFEFCLERLKNWYHSHQIAPNIFMAIANTNTTNILDFSKKIKALTNFLNLEEAQTLTNANKRVKNILQKHENKKEITGNINDSLLKEKAEFDLYNTITNIENKNKELIEQENYDEVLKNLTQIDNALENFFNKVMVMVEDNKIKLNRLNLLQRIRNNFLKVADISLL